MSEEAEKAYYLAIDIGASSGRHILGWLEEGKVCIEEVYRFENCIEENNNHLCWNLDKLFQNILTGLQRCKQLNRIPKSVGIDTWGVDFVLLDQENKVLGDTIAYRDMRTKGMDVEVYKVITEEELYCRSGIQKQIFNSVYQLAALRQQNPEILKRAQSFLMIPEYLNFLLTGEKKNEYTNATTTQLVHAKMKDWDYELIERLELPRRIFGKLHMPGSMVGHLLPEVEALLGFSFEVVFPATHDTGSAVLAVPANNDEFIYLSSGTWSLMGIERLLPDCSEKSRKHNFTNEGGYDYRYRYLKNIMGLWMMQCIRKEFKNKYSFEEIFTLAEKGSHFSSLLDVNDSSFLAPKSMIGAVLEYCARTGQETPKNESELFFCVYNSLARCYADTVMEIEELTERVYSRIYIVGGGCQDTFLNKLTARHTGKDVYAGPVEATAIGNLMTQMLKSKEFSDLSEARESIARSFNVKKV